MIILLDYNWWINCSSDGAIKFYERYKDVALECTDLSEHGCLLKGEPQKYLDKLKGTVNKHEGLGPETYFIPSPFDILKLRLKDD